MNSIEILSHFLPFHTTTDITMSLDYRKLDFHLTIYLTMSNLKLQTDPRVFAKFEQYPDMVKSIMLRLRELVITTAQEMEDIAVLEETLKWGEPSYITKDGSTLRMDWKEKTPNQYALYFQCSSRLVTTFKMVFDQLFQYEGSRAIIFDLHQKLPETALKECIKATLRYHKVKHMLTLGI